ncbi:(Fe-S)-binding protein [bacterium]|nr:(Fe-S)-binding protein [bacterium]
METKYLKDWEKDLNCCIRCAYCFEGCPIFKEMGWEIDGARGKAVLSYGLLVGDIEPSQYIVDKLYECTFCKDCVERCSANVQIPDILAAIRADFVEAGYKYDSHTALLEKIDKSGNIFGKELHPPETEEEGEIPVLLGCRFLERTEEAKRYLDLLRALGVKPKVFDETCCGMPYAVLGYKEGFKRQQDKFRESVPGKKIICLCTTCVFFIRKKYPDLEAVYVIDEVVKRLPETAHKKLGIKATYHDPCNVSRGMNMVDEPRQIMEEIGVELIEMPTKGKQAECCGGGGGVLVTNKTLSTALAKNRAEQAIDVGAELLVTLCPTCELNIGNAAKDNGGELEVKNLLDLIYDAVV